MPRIGRAVPADALFESASLKPAVRLESCVKKNAADSPGTSRPARRAFTRFFQKEMAPPVGLEPTGHGMRRRQPCHPWLHLAALLRRHKKPRARHAGQKEEGGLQPSINRKECREKSSFFLTFELKNRKKIVRKKPAAPVDDDGHSEDVNASCRKARRHRIRRRRRVSCSSRRPR